MKENVNVSPKILCIGDIMLDTFIYGSINRISPEAPVPVFEQNTSSIVLGGVGNVARNAFSLGAKVILVSVVGDDEASEKITNLCSEFYQTFLLKDKYRKTTQKKRFCSNNQHLLRVDIEEKKELQIEDEDKLLDFCYKNEPDVLIISDYAKGVISKRLCNELIRAFQKIPILVDPKVKDFSKYKGATIIKPNEKEFINSIQFKTDLEASASEVIKNGISKNLVITRGEKGMLVVNDKETVYIESKAREVFDVSGAGDTVIATMAFFLGKGENVLHSAHMANKAAGIVVKKSGTSIVTSHELIEKSFNIDIVKDQVKLWKEKGLKIGVANGCFDLFHSGHLHLINQAKGLCDKLILAVNSDTSVRRLKGNTRPIHTEETRANILSHLKIVDAVIIFEEDTPINVIETLKPDFIFKGKDYNGKEVIGSSFIETYGGKVILLNLLDGISTTEIIRKTAKQ